MVEVTPADREAAKNMDRQNLLGCYLEEHIDRGDYDHVPAIQQFATHRIKAAKAERDRCEKIARDYAAKAAQRGWVTSPESAATAAKHIATAIKESQP